MYEIMAVKKEVKISDITQSEKELLKKKGSAEEGNKLSKVPNGFAVIT